jgi:hypothetical protein
MGDQRMEIRRLCRVVGQIDQERHDGVSVGISKSKCGCDSGLPSAQVVPRPRRYRLCLVQGPKDKLTRSVSGVEKEEEERKGKVGEWVAMPWVCIVRAKTAPVAGSCDDDTLFESVAHCRSLAQPAILGGQHVEWLAGARSIRRLWYS